MTPEQDILVELLDQAERSATGVTETVAMIGDFPADATVFDAMPPIQGIATTALLKQFEQPGALHGAFRVSLKMMGVSLEGLYPLDIGERMAELDVLDDGATLLAALKLRNELAHEYPFHVHSRLTRTPQAFEIVATLQDALVRLRRFISTRRLLDT